jgi:nucleotide-binding universal stress UspA family protein
VASRSTGDNTVDHIVVGIGDSGPDHYLAALDLAARMGSQREAVIILVHGCLPRLSIARNGSEAQERHMERGRQRLEEAELALTPMLDVTSSAVSLAAVTANGVDALLQESQTATTLIVQRRNPSPLGRAIGGGTCYVVAAQAACPVIVVRRDQLGSDSRRGVVVGVSPHSGLRALQVGVTEAAVRKCPLTAVCVWDLQFSPTYGSWIDPDEEELAEAARWADSVLATAVSTAAELHPDVEFHARSVKGVIEEGLLQECEHAELLVVERHRDAHRASIGLGTLTRHLIDHAPCPVVVTPHSDAADDLHAGDDLAAQ